MEYPYSGITRGLKYLAHLLRAGNGHSIHSPSVFALYNRLIQRDSDEDTTKIRAFHNLLKRRTERIEFLDPGKNNLPQNRSVGKIASQSAKGYVSGKILYNLVGYLKPNKGLELGTSMGISALYQQLACPSMEFTTIEGVPEIAELAQKNIEKYAHKTTILTGLFEDVLTDLSNQKRQFDYVYIDGHHQKSATLKYVQTIKTMLAAESCVVLDDIHWSKGMEEAWEEIRKDPKVATSIDLFHFGILLFGENLVKQHFVLRA
jgi:predicted O-methyltransferase YrrM